MPRTPRLLRSDEPSVYHVISRTALEGFPLDDVEKDFMLEVIKRYAALYFVEILGFCLMGNHFHLVVRTFPGSEFTDEDIKRRYKAFYGEDKSLAEGQIPFLRMKLSSLSEFVREIKVKGDRYFMLDTVPSLRVYGCVPHILRSEEGGRTSCPAHFLGCLGSLGSLG